MNPESLPIASALELILEKISPVAELESLPLRESLGRILAADLISPIAVPAHDNAAMDGYALRGADLREDAASRLRLAGSALAGRPYAGTVGAGQCVRIMTGAMLPAGADTVVVQEIARAEGDLIFIPAGQSPGANCRRAGEDLVPGQVALAAGTLIRPAELGLAASLGLQQVTVRRRPRVAFFSTGDEVRAAGETLNAGQVYDSNGATLYGMLTRLGCDTLDLGVVPDDPAALEAAFRRAAAEADAVISSGGVSVGDADFTRPLMEKLGDVLFWSLALRPGRPMAFGRLGPALFFGLPGNPVAVMVSFYLLVRPALLALMGRRDTSPQLQAIAQHTLPKKAGRTEVLRGVLESMDGEWRVRRTGDQGSGMLSSMSRANCLIVLEHDRGKVAEGDLVDVLLFEGLA